MSVWVPARRHEPERMDGAIARDAVQGALRDIALVNRLLGGRRALLDPLDMALDFAAGATPLSVLDVGTGGGDLPVGMVRHALRRGRRVRVTAVDRDRWVVEVAARRTEAFPEVRVVRADAARLPFRTGAFDLVTASMFLHHFDHRALVALLAAFRRLARIAVVVNDLRRHRLPWAFIALASTLTRRHPVFRHDAPLSVLRGFTEDELRSAARDAGVPEPCVERRWPFRLVMVLPGGGTS